MRKQDVNEVSASHDIWGSLGPGRVAAVRTVWYLMVRPATVAMLSFHLTVVTGWGEK